MFAMRLQTIPAPRTPQCCRRQVVANAEKKGFGASTSTSKGKKEKSGKKAKARKSKGKTNYRPIAKTSSMIAARSEAEAEDSSAQLNPNEAAASPRTTVMPADIQPDIAPQPPEEKAMTVGQELAFESRLAELKENSKVLAKEKALKKTSPDAAFAPPPGTKSSDPYKNPPSIMDTMAKTEKSDDKVDVFGSNQVTALGASILLAAALLFGTIYTGDGGDDSGRKRKVELSNVEKEQLQAQQATFASRLETNPEDSEALEGAAVTDINLGDYEKGESLLAQLVAVKSDDPDAWRLLAESRTALGRTAAAVEAYKGAFAASPDDVVLLKGLAGSLVADGRQSVAVDEIKAVRARLTAAPSQGSSTGADAAAGDDVPRLTAIELDLLLAKVYAQWKGHVGDAFEVYDNVIVDNPEDFRGFLAKGVLLRKEGRKSDADRAFLQARFLAPKELRSIVDRVAAPES